jgi:hypothetical protein
MVVDGNVNPFDDVVEHLEAKPNGRFVYRVSYRRAA